MKNLLSLLGILFFLNVFGQEEKQSMESFSFMEMQYTQKQEEVDLRGLCWLSRGPSTGLGYWGFLLTVQGINDRSLNFGEALFGLKQSKSLGGVYIEYGLGAGFETDESLWRSSAYIYAFMSSNRKDGVGDMYVFANPETGATGYWHIIAGNYNISRSWGVGFISQTYSVHGIRVEFRPKDFILLWTGQGVVNGDYGFMVSSRLFF